MNGSVANSETAMKDPTEWMNDLSFYMDDGSVADTAATIEPTLHYGGSKAAAGGPISRPAATARSNARSIQPSIANEI